MNNSRAALVPPLILVPAAGARLLRFSEWRLVTARAAHRRRRHRRPPPPSCYINADQYRASHCTAAGLASTFRLSQRSSTSSHRPTSSSSYYSDPSEMICRARRSLHDWNSLTGLQVASRDGVSTTSPLAPQRSTSAHTRTLREKAEKQFSGKRLTKRESRLAAIHLAIWQVQPRRNKSGPKSLT